ncbi:MAG TPA: hypothetical protein VGN98_11295 [Tianweitania sediminis]|jgi:hypothetical protein|nr:hypothetical protein [Tianweitania sediminis]
MTLPNADNNGTHEPQQRAPGGPQRVPGTLDRLKRRGLGPELIEKFYETLSLIYFFTATLLLILTAILLLGSAVWRIAASLWYGDVVSVSLDAIGLMIIGFAIVETAKFIGEEELLRNRELRSSMESRRSITKFTTIIVIAMSLEALVMTFKASQESLSEAVYPAFLFVAAMFSLIALGIYQFLSSRIEPASHEERLEADPDLEG